MIEKLIKEKKARFLGKPSWIKNKDIRKSARLIRSKDNELCVSELVNKAIRTAIKKKRDS